MCYKYTNLKRDVTNLSALFFANLEPTGTHFEYKQVNFYSFYKHKWICEQWHNLHRIPSLQKAKHDPVT